MIKKSNKTQNFAQSLTLQQFSLIASPWRTQICLAVSLLFILDCGHLVLESHLNLSCFITSFAIICLLFDSQRKLNIVIMKAFLGSLSFLPRYSFKIFNIKSFCDMHMCGVCMGVFLSPLFLQLKTRTHWVWSSLWPAAALDLPVSTSELWAFRSLPAWLFTWVLGIHTWTLCSHSRHSSHRTNS